MRRAQAIVLLTTFATFLCCGTSTHAQSPATPKKVALEYKLKAGEKIISRVEHVAETRTSMAGQDEASSSRTVSEKIWEVTEVNSKNEMTFEYRINSVSLAQSVGENEELTFDSTKDSDVPDMFKPVAETIGKTLATVTINAQGQVLNRDKELKTPQLGMGELTIPLPAYPIAIGERWSVPREIRVKLEDGTHKKIKVRELYSLEKVTTGVATISIVTQPLTPVSDPAVEAQMIQQLSKGKIRFDLDKGRLISKRLDWSEEVVGFRGADTRLQYDGKFTEELISGTRRTASSSQGSAAK